MDKIYVQDFQSKEKLADSVGMDTQIIREIEIPTQESDRQMVTTEYERYVAFAYLLLLFSSVESSLRI
jgi:intergrase/recombinase